MHQFGAAAERVRVNRTDGIVGQIDRVQCGHVPEYMGRYVLELIAGQPQRLQVRDVLEVVLMDLLQRHILHLQRQQKLERSLVYEEARRYIVDATVAYDQIADVTAAAVVRKVVVVRVLVQRVEAIGDARAIRDEAMVVDGQVLDPVAVRIWRALGQLAGIRSITESGHKHHQQQPLQDSDHNVPAFEKNRIRVQFHVRGSSVSGWDWCLWCGQRCTLCAVFE